MNLKGQLTFGKQQLVLNSAKNKFEHNEEENINEINNNEEIKSLNSSTISSQTIPLSTAETGFNNITENSEDLNTQIKNSLKKISEQYCQYDKKGSLFNYYCSPFLFKAHKRKNIFFDNKGETNINENDLYIKCPFESCKDK